MIRLRAAALPLESRPILQEIDFAADRGEFVALCGPNGAGKSTLLRGLAGLLPGGRPEPRRVAYLEQGARCAWGLSVSELVALGRIPHGDADTAAIERALAACALDGLRHRRMDRISGGEARRAMLARVLATEPEVMLLDEPTADLDPAAAHAILGLLADRVRGGTTVVAVLHAVDLAIRYATRITVLRAGRIVADAPPGAALPALARAFGLPWGTDPTPRLLPP